MKSHTPNIRVLEAIGEESAFYALNDERDLRRELTRISHLIYSKGYNSSIDGNLSGLLPDGNIIITPSGQHNGFIEPEQFIITNPDGIVLSDGKPSSEIALHLEIYRSRPDIGAVIHSHAPFSIAASLAGIDLMEMFISVAPVPTLKYARPSSKETAFCMRPFIKGYDWAIIPRHGVVTLGKTPWDAFLRLEGLEHLAKIVTIACSTGRPIEPMSEEHRHELLSFWNLSPKGEFVN